MELSLRERDRMAVMRQASEAPEPAASARGAGRAGAVGQLGPSVDRGPGAGRPGAGGAARRRDVPDAARALRRARHGRGEPAGDHRVRRGLEQLGVELVLAGSPQAKGRVERTFGTAQDRLVKEMRVAEGSHSRATASGDCPERTRPTISGHLRICQTARSIAAFSTHPPRLL